MIQPTPPTSKAPPAKTTIGRDAGTKIQATTGIKTNAITAFSKASSRRRGDGRRGMAIAQFPGYPAISIWSKTSLAKAAAILESAMDQEFTARLCEARDMG